MKSGFHFSPDGGASEGGVTLKAKCEACLCVVREDDLSIYNGYNLCSDCVADYKEDDNEEKAIEAVHQISMNDLPMDKLQTLLKMVDFEFNYHTKEAQNKFLNESKPLEEAPENVVWWLNTVKIAIDSKKNKA